MSDPRLAELGTDVLRLLEKLDLRAVNVSPIGRFRNGHRSCYRLRLADGVTVKARIAPTAGDACRIETLSGHLPSELFPRVLGREGRALLVEWIPGRSVTVRDCTREFMERCGALLATVHLVEPPNDPAWWHPTTEQPAGERLSRDLHRLAELGGLTSTQARRLAEAAGRHAPEEIAVGLVHWDLCAANVIAGSDGEPRVIDQDTLYIGPRDGDLARTWYRWSLTNGQLGAFLAGYRSDLDTTGFESSFWYWAVSALVDSALWRLHMTSREARVPLSMLEEAASAGLESFGNPGEWR
jgi:hypothetical protein